MHFVLLMGSEANEDAWGASVSGQLMNELSSMWGFHGDLKEPYPGRQKAMLDKITEVAFV